MGRRRVTSPLPIRRNPKKYEPTSKVILKDIDERLDKIVEKMDLKENETVLDYGCGPGFNCMSYLVPLAEKLNWTVYAVDNSDSMIKAAKEINPHFKIQYVLGDVLDEDFPLKGIKFDRIFSIHYMQFLADDLKDIIKELYKLLAPGGIMFLTTAHSELLENIHRSQIELKEWGDIAKEHLAMMESILDCIRHPDEWKKALEDMNIEVKELSPSLDVTYTFDALTTLADVWFTHNSFALHLPEDERKQLRADYIRVIQETKTNVYTPSPGSENKEYTIRYDRVDMILTN